MTITIYHNPRCSKSRQALEIIRGKGIDPVIVEYLNNPLSLAELEELFSLLKLDSANAMIRLKESELSKDSSNEEILKAIAANPKLLERPIVVTSKGARIGRPTADAIEVVL